MKHYLTSLLLIGTMFSANAEVAIQSVGGWFEGGYVTWSPVEGATSYNVYYKATDATEYIQLDAPLVREYKDYGRADVLGITAGTYQFKVVPVDANGEMAGQATQTATFEAKSHDRGGFAHFKTASSTFNPANGIGAYKNDGTLKAGAKVIYVCANNAKSVTTDVITDSKGSKTTGTGFQAIIDLYQKGYDKTPIDFRIIGTIKAEDMDKFSSSAEGLQIKGKAAYSEMNITIEGVGNDATIHGFGFLMRNACSIELRNFAIMLCMDDAVSMDTDNSNLWIHNLDLFYGRPGGAADQKKGDGTLDIKGDSKYSTLSYNHMWDNGKSSLCGMTSESGPNYLTYHHNWFDHSDSRHPRIRTMSVHIYNNYYDGNSKYGVGATSGSDVFVENNYFRNCKYPMLSSKQGSDVHNGVGTSDQTKGTFSGEDGGSIKAFGNYMTGQKSFEPYVADDATYSRHFDAYVAKSRDEQVPATVVALLGGDTYSNFDTDASLMYSDYLCDEASLVPAIVTGSYGAGRCQHGDFSWTFGASEDNNDQVIASLSTAIQNYQSTLVGFYGEAVGNGGGSSDNHQGGSDEGGSDNDDDTPGNDDGSDNTPFEGTQICSFSGTTPSLSMVKIITGNSSTSKGSVSYDGKSYSNCIKMESATEIVITPTSDCSITLIFGGTTSASGSKIKLDGVTKTCDNNGLYTFEAKANQSIVLKKGDSINLFLIVFKAADFGSNLSDMILDAIEDIFYDLGGHQVVQPQSNAIYIRNGRKIRF